MQVSKKWKKLCYVSLTKVAKAGLYCGLAITYEARIGGKQPELKTIHKHTAYEEGKEDDRERIRFRGKYSNSSAHSGGCVFKFFAVVKF